MKYVLHDFKGMDGVKKKLKGPIVKTVSAADRVLRKYRIVSNAGDYGALNIWKDDHGDWHGEFMQHCITKNHMKFKHKKSVLIWFQKWNPKLRATP